MQQTCDTVKAIPSVKAPGGETPWNDDKGRHVFECDAFSHDV
jgi:hypothetical protein